MSETQKKIKKVSLTKLEKLTDQELLERIKEKEIRIKEKQDYYDLLNKLNLDRLAAYKKYREEDTRACQTILNKRKNPQPVEKKVP